MISIFEVRIVFGERVPAVINTKWFQLKPNFAFYSEAEPSLII